MVDLFYFFGFKSFVGYILAIKLFLSQKKQEGKNKRQILLMLID